MKDIITALYRVVGESKIKEPIHEYIWPDLDKYTINRKITPTDYRLLCQNTRHVDDYRNPSKSVIVELRKKKTDDSTLIIASQFSDVNYRTLSILPEKAKLIVHVGTWPTPDMAKKYMETKLNK